MSNKPLFPTRRDLFEKQWPAFKRWLSERGSEILPPTNEYELARFTSMDGVAIIYRNDTNVILAAHWRNGAAEAWRAWKHNKPWEVGRRVGRKVPDVRLRAVIVRDGETCIYCRKPFTDDRPMTREHFVQISHGGGNHISNLGVAHDDCNEAVNHMAVAEKIEFAIRARIAAGTLFNNGENHEPITQRNNSEALGGSDNVDQGRPELAECDTGNKVGTV